MKIKLILLFATGLGAIIAAPFLAKKYIEHKYNVSAEKINYGCKDSLLCLSIDNVSIAHNNINVHAKYIVIDSISGPIKVISGTANIKKSSETKNGSYSSESILDKLSIVDFEVTITKNNDKAVLHNVSYKDGVAIFDSADISYHNKKISALHGSIFRNESLIRIDRLETDVIIPFKLPKINAEQKLIIKDFSTYIKKESVKAGSIQIGPVEFKNVSVIKNGSDIAFDSEFLTINHPWLAIEPVTFKEIAATYIKSLNKIDAQFSNNVHLDFDLTNYHVTGTQDCNEWVSILPEPLPNALKQTIGNYSGELSFEIQVKPKPLFTLKNKCDYSCSKPPITMPPSSRCVWESCDGLFLNENLVSYEAYDGNGKRKQRLIIKGSDANPAGAGWMPLQYIPIYVTNAFVALEDRGFYKHNGVLDSAIQNSLIANLQLGRFMRGGSTITMQLAKNLWLTREKTLLRKIHEIFLTIPLEKCLTKEQILELYLNIIEFGPNIYGIDHAADYYFHSAVGQLTEEQAFYLAMILPSPKKALFPDKGGLARAQKMLKERDEYHDALASFEDEGENE